MLTTNILELQLRIKTRAMAKLTWLDRIKKNQSLSAVAIIARSGF